MSNGKMDNIQFQSYSIEERSYVSFVKREIHTLVRPHYSDKRAGEIDIVISEAASNLIKHAVRGEILYRLSFENEEPVFEMICIDKGPGIKDLVHSMKDGVSSKNTLGHGLGSITRLSNLAQIYSQVDWGTIVYSKIYNDPAYQPPKKNLQARFINVAKPGEHVSGDGLSLRFLQGRTMILVGDGLGHGPHAKEAVDRAIEAFRSSHYSEPSEILREINVAVKKTRGLVATVMTINHVTKELHVCGIGNIYTRIQRGLEYNNYVSNNGVVGMNIPTRIENAVYKAEKMQLLIFCSDGIKTKWELSRYPGILKYDPMMVAAVLYKDHARQTDDMTVMVAKLT